MKKFLLILSLIFFSILPILANNETTILPSQIGSVINVEYIEDNNEITPLKQVANVKILNGVNKNKIITVENIFTDNPYFDIKLSKGMKKQVAIWLAVSAKPDVLILDEAHIIDSDGRGANAQILIKRIAQRFSNCRIILLSGTMSNATQIAKWIKSLNNKKTFVIRSDWRPVQNVKNTIIYIDENDKYSKLYQLLEQNCYDKIVVFVYSKANGNELSKKLCKAGINAAFISSDLSKTKRNKILNAFRLGQINVLISTSLLSQGVNLG